MEESEKIPLFEMRGCGCIIFKLPTHIADTSGAKHDNSEHFWLSYNTGKRPKAGHYVTCRCAWYNLGRYTYPE